MDAGGAWIAEFRHEHGLTRQDMAKCMTDVFGVHTSELLIACAETGDRIHPGIAARIAYLAGGKAEQFNAITYKTRRGTWKPDAAERKRVKQRFERWMNRRAVSIAAMEAERKKRFRRVLQIGPDGNVVREFPTAEAAAEAINAKGQTIRDRCQSKYSDDFRKFGVVWRYADMYTPEERDRVIARAKQQLKPVEDARHAQRYDRLELNGEIHSLEEWADKLDTTVDVVRNRLRRGWSKRDALTIPPYKWGGPRGCEDGGSLPQSARNALTAPSSEGAKGTTRGSLHQSARNGNVNGGSLPQSKS